MNKFVSGRVVKRRKASRKPANKTMQPTIENLEPRVVPSGVPQPDHVVVVMEENHAYNEIIGSSAAPYINALAKQGARDPLLGDIEIYYKAADWITRPSR